MLLASGLCKAFSRNAQGIPPGRLPAGVEALPGMKIMLLAPRAARAASGEGGDEGRWRCRSPLVFPPWPRWNTDSIGAACVRMPRRALGGRRHVPELRMNALAHASTTQRANASTSPEDPERTETPGAGFGLVSTLPRPNSPECSPARTRMSRTRTQRESRTGRVPVLLSRKRSAGYELFPFSPRMAVDTCPSIPREGIGNLNIIGQKKIDDHHKRGNNNEWW